MSFQLCVELRFCSSWRAKLNLEMKHVELSTSATPEMSVFWDVRLDHEYVFNWFWCGWVLWSLFFFWRHCEDFFCVVFDAGKVFVLNVHRYLSSEILRFQETTPKSPRVVFFSTVRSTREKFLQTKCSKDLRGRILDPEGRPLDGPDAPSFGGNKREIFRRCAKPVICESWRFEIWGMLRLVGLIRFWIIYVLYVFFCKLHPRCFFTRFWPPSSSHHWLCEVCRCPRRLRCAIFLWCLSRSRCWPAWTMVTGLRVKLGETRHSLDALIYSSFQ